MHTVISVYKVISIRGNSRIFRTLLLVLRPMKTCIVLVISGLLLTSPLIAQETKSSVVAESAPGADLLAASQNRASLASQVEDTDESAQKALEELASMKNPSGLPVGKDASMGFAATDIGHRLLAAGKPTAAEVFFQAAENSLSNAVERTPDDLASEKSSYLQNLARIRGNYLGKHREAQEDMAAAAALQPDDERLQRLSKNYTARLNARLSPAGKEATR